MILLSLLPAFLRPCSAQPVPEFTSGAEYLAYVEQLREDIATLEAKVKDATASAMSKADELRAQAEAETDPVKKQRLLDEAALVARSGGMGVGSREDRELLTLQQRLRDVQNRYKFVFEEAFPFYEERERYSKEALKESLKAASRQIRRSPTGKALKKYIKTLP